MFQALYVHIPFCKQRCHYCDFTTEALPGHEDKKDAYLTQLIKDIRAASKQGDLAQIKTIYLGGGTPSFFGHRRLVELAYTLSLSLKLEEVEEYTFEANPESLTLPLVKDLFALGVNRLSLGVQSFVDTELATLGRAHDAAVAEEAIALAQSRFDNVSIDLMCGIPGQTAESWHASLSKALSCMPAHISVYPLQFEEGTMLYQAVKQGEREEIDEDKQAELLEQAASMLNGAGYVRYEVASYARPGQQSKHNRVYWTGVEYLGLGRGAASMRNLPDGSRERKRTGETPELLSAEEAMAEDLMLAMRMSAGISEAVLTQAESLLPNVRSVFGELQELGLVSSETEQYVPTKRGWLLGNELYSRIWALAATD